MKPIAAARQWWAACRPRPALRVTPQGQGTALAPASSGLIARGTSILLLALAAALIGCAAVGLTVTQANDRRLAAERYARVQSALDELHAVVGTVRRIDAAELRFVARRSRLDDLRFAADPPPERGREFRSLQDAQGRIVGWLSWAPDRALIGAMQWLWALAGAISVALMGCAVLAARRTRRVEGTLLLRELKSALAAQAFDVHYQPIVAAAGGAIIGVEALLRWTHPRRGAIPPSTFVAVAEACGLMQDLGELVLSRALADAARWPNLFVAVNLSPVQMRDPHFVDLVAALLARSTIAPSRLVLEMTEGILVDDPNDIQLRLEALRGLGVSLALDDFGTGYSSLSYLQKFPFQRLKIDRAFVAALGTVGNAGAIIHSIVGLGHALGMTVLAEGVETDEQRVLLRLAGCDELQGYLFATPCPAAAIDGMVPRAAAARAPAAPAAIAS